MYIRSSTLLAKKNPISSEASLFLYPVFYPAKRNNNNNIKKGGGGEVVAQACQEKNPFYTTTPSHPF